MENLQHQWKVENQQQTSKFNRIAMVVLVIALLCVAGRIVEYTTYLFHHESKVLVETVSNR